MSELKFHLTGADALIAQQEQQITELATQLGCTFQIIPRPKTGKKFKIIGVADILKKLQTELEA